MKLKKALSKILLFLTVSNIAIADISGAPALVYDSNGNVLNSTSNALNTFVTNASLPVTQSGTWTVQPGNTANTTPWLVTVSTALPTGANTIGAVTQAGGPWTQNITQFGGVALSTGVGASGTGIPRVTVANDSNILATQSGTWTVQQGGAPWSQNVTQVGGAAFTLGQKTSANSAPVVLASDQSAIQVVVGNPTVGTYVATAVNLTPAAVATDIFTITGSATKTVRIYKVRILGNKTTASVASVNLIKRSTLDTGGTSTPVTATQMDSGDAAATAVVTQYTANPTALGTSVGIASANPTFIPNTVTQLFQALFSDFGMRKALTLNNANENVAVNLGATTVTGGSLTVEVTWTEQ